MNETLLLQKGQAFLALQPFSVLIGAELHALIENVVNNETVSKQIPVRVMMV